MADTIRLVIQKKNREPIVFIEILRPGRTRSSGFWGMETMLWQKK